MKRLIILLMLLLAVSFVVAQEDNSTLKKIDTLEFKDSITKVAIGERDALRLIYNNIENIIQVRELDESNNKAQLLIFVGKSEVPYYLTLSKGLTVKLDVERDNKDDFMLIFDSIKDNKLNIIIEKIEDKANKTIEKNDVLQEVLKEDSKRADLKIGIIISLIIIIGGSLIFIATKPRKKLEV